MFFLKLRSLKFTERLALCLVALPLLVLYLNWNRARADGDCPNTSAKKIPCIIQGSAPCDTYSPEEMCKGKTQVVIYVNNFTTESFLNKMAVPVTNNGEAVQKDCYAEYECDWVSDTCVKGKLKGNLVQSPIWTTEDCPK